MCLNYKVLLPFWCNWCYVVHNYCTQLHGNFILVLQLDFLYMCTVQRAVLQLPLAFRVLSMHWRLSTLYRCPLRTCGIKMGSAYRFIFFKEHLYRCRAVLILTYAKKPLKSIWHTGALNGLEVWKSALGGKIYFNISTMFEVISRSFQFGSQHLPILFG